MDIRQYKGLGQFTRLANPGFIGNSCYGVWGQLRSRKANPKRSMGQVVSILAGFAVICCVPTYGADQKGCPLKVVVVDNQNQEVAAPIRVLEDAGRIHEAENDLGGVLFCDLGILPVTVEVGTSRTCYQHIFKNVVLFPGQTIVLKAILDTSECNQTRPVFPGVLCSVVLRFRGEGDKPIPDVEVTLTGRDPVVSDHYGRLYFLLKRSEALVGSVSDNRFKMQPIRFLCTDETRKKEIEVVLQAKDPIQGARGTEHYHCGGGGVRVVERGGAFGAVLFWQPAGRDVLAGTGDGRRDRGLAAVIAVRDLRRADVGGRTGAGAGLHR